MAAPSRLLQVAKRSTADRAAAMEHCELCGEPIPPEHKHVLEVATRDLRCTCRACAILFDRPAAAEGRYKLVPDRRLRIEDLELEDLTWEELRLPVDMAFFFFASPEDRMVAYYPSPMGPTESLLDLSAWEELASANPILRTLAPDVEALLVNRVRGARQHWIVPIDECYALVGLIRAHWRGLTGGSEVWEQIARNFEQLDRRSRPAGRDDQRS
jgi:hypothetical protein